MRYEIKLNTILTVLIIGTIVSKLILISTGMFAFPDETRYDGTIHALYDFKNINLKGFLSWIFSTDARPVDAFVRIVPAFLQHLSHLLFNIDLFDPKNTYPIFIFNYIVHILIIVIHYRISKIFIKEQSLTLLSVLIFSSLINSFLYLRHCLPYDSSLLLLYFVLYQFIKHYNLHQITNKKLFQWGVIMTIACLIYPGYSLFFASFSMLLLIMLYLDNGLIKSIKLYFNYILSGCFVIMLTEVLARIGGRSYFGGFKDYITNVSAGPSGENFIFIFKYLIQVEGLNGWILILGVSFYILSLIFILKKNEFKSIIVMTFFCFSAILVLATVVYFFSGIHLYGRVIHQFMPLICIFAVLPLYNLFYRQKHLVMGIGAITICVIISFSIHLQNYLTYAYPRDTYYSFIQQNVTHKELTEFNNTHGYRYRYPEKTNNNPETSNNDADVILVNNYLYFPFTDIEQTEIIISDNYSLIYSKPHFLNFKAYQFEGDSIEARKNYDHYKLHIKVYKKLPAANSGYNQRVKKQLEP